MCIRDRNNIIESHLTGTFLSCKIFGGQMAKIGGGSIVNISSVVGFNPGPVLAYGAAKGAIINLSKSLSVQWASNNVRVNAIAPVAGLTPLLKSFMGGNTRKKKQSFLSTIPIGRFSTPQDMGNAASFLCSDEATMITGVVLEVDGGRCI